MTTVQQVGFRLLFWLAARLVDGALTDDQRKELRSIAVSYQMARDSTLT